MPAPLARPLRIRPRRAFLVAVVEVDLADDGGPPMCCRDERGDFVECAEHQRSHADERQIDLFAVADLARSIGR